MCVYVYLCYMRDFSFNNGGGGSSDSDAHLNDMITMKDADS